MKWLAIIVSVCCLIGFLNAVVSLYVLGARLSPALADRLVPDGEPWVEEADRIGLSAQAQYRALVRQMSACLSISMGMWVTYLLGP